MEKPESAVRWIVYKKGKAVDAWPLYWFEKGPYNLVMCRRADGRLLSVSKQSVTFSEKP